MSVAERIQRQLSPYEPADPENLLPRLGAGLVAALEICDVARDTDTHIAWGTVLDPDFCPRVLLPWLAQFSGDQPVDGETEQQTRDRLTSPSNFYRGTLDAIRAEMRPTLTGAQTVLILERVGGDEFEVTIITRTAETPDPAATEAAGRRQLAPWLLATFLVTNDVIWEEATLTWDEVDPSVTWADVTLADVT